MGCVLTSLGRKELTVKINTTGCKRTLHIAKWGEGREQIMEMLGTCYLTDCARNQPRSGLAFAQPWVATCSGTVGLSFPELVPLSSFLAINSLLIVVLGLMMGDACLSTSPRLSPWL